MHIHEWDLYHIPKNHVHGLHFDVAILLLSHSIIHWCWGNDVIFLVSGVTYITCIHQRFQYASQRGNILYNL